MTARSRLYTWLRTFGSTRLYYGYLSGFKGHLGWRWNMTLFLKARRSHSSNAISRSSHYSGRRSRSRSRTNS